MQAPKLSAALLIALLLCLPVQAADDQYGSAAKDDGLKPARTQIAQKDWPGAIITLNAYTRANPQDANGYNLLGYSYRQLQRYNESLDAYQRALTLDPKHRGAHEYIGEAYIALGRLDKAREHLEALDKICFLPCEEYRDLKRSYEAALRSK
ncbi:MAG: tetratricopeptide repeat protein [Burkholderiaceae bacterium]|jgi:cytochrome c-type biogenesis protein CcmH/NrfG|nr:tetratricopeptide repeat protein [Burkholderiaceae bacterium]